MRIDDEVIDLIAEAAKISPHARRAYELIRQDDPRNILPLDRHQSFIANRMAEIPL